MTPKLELPTTADAEPDAKPTLQAVFPYRGHERGRSVRAGRARGVLVSADGPDGRVGTTVCPACESETINGVGLFACTSCSWQGRLR
ncbi:hypothetical protein [Natrialbaceae archaeon AArc-T1-2]|uniref:hypothetical protein n=1 Tax=Natrialbaceae archaeon AArc-T1-2 TaxID=3053904 RepID=UPI00255A8EF2|nr:hypothetical protein [Natrialbaceae archaeon AArc-T1-2]WIV66507.1 hypothetical protein QQ977_12505 [Natrialbaceae archaeon AArc-T1-2]